MPCQESSRAHPINHPLSSTADHPQWRPSLVTPWQPQLNHPLSLCHHPRYHQAPIAIIANTDPSNPPQSLFHRTRSNSCFAPSQYRAPRYHQAPIAIIANAASLRPPTLSRRPRTTPCFAVANPSGYWDNGASYHLVNALQLLYDTTPISPPMQVDGVGGRVLLTHQGRLKALPTLNNMNRAYYSKELSTNLISLGFLQRSGATYGADPTRPHTHVTVRLGLTGPTLATIPLSSNNLLPIDFAELEKSTRASNHARSRPFIPNTSTLPPRQKPHALISVHHTAEQLRRAEEAEQLHHDRNHPSDDALCADLSHGKIPWCTLTCPDIRLNRTLRGPCIHCLAGKMTTPQAPTSTSEPATAPGAVLSFDIHQLPETSPGGFTHAIHVVDEHSGKLDVIGSTSKTTLAVSRAVRQLIVEYNADGHRVKRMHGDAEKINASLSPTIGLLGITLQLSLSGEHAKRIERYHSMSESRPLSPP